jgi:DNA-binding NarL/FixJ family response regulator
VKGDDLDHPVSILVLDEPGMMRTSLRALLATIPYIQLCRPADLADACDDLVEEQHPDCVLMVCTIPNQDPQLLEFITTLKRTRPEIRCLVITISSERNREYLAAGADLGLVNGFSLGDLCQSIGSLFHLKEANEFR